MSVKNEFTLQDQEINYIKNKIGNVMIEIQEQENGLFVKINKDTGNNKYKMIYEKFITTGDLN